MNEQEIDKLAEAIVAKMMAKQKEYDEVFLEDIKIMVDKDPNVDIVIDDGESKVRDKIKHLEEELAIAVADERFLDASNYQQQINNLKDKYNL
jgi:6-phosphogluconate dehydrogenase (decarboxylating)